MKYTYLLDDDFEITFEADSDEEAERTAYHEARDLADRRYDGEKIVEYKLLGR